MSCGAHAVACQAAAATVAMHSLCPWQQVCGCGLLTAQLRRLQVRTEVEEAVAAGRLDALRHRWAHWHGLVAAALLPCSCRQLGSTVMVDSRLPAANCLICPKKPCA